MPYPDGLGVVGMPVWMWSGPGPSRAGSASAGAVTVVAVAWVRVWSMGDGAIVPSVGPGDPANDIGRRGVRDAHAADRPEEQDHHQDDACTGPVPEARRTGCQGWDHRLPNTGPYGIPGSRCGPGGHVRGGVRSPSTMTSTAEPGRGTAHNTP